MDWTAAIEKNHVALKRILATLVAMAGLAGGAKIPPRRLYRAVLALLVPAESAARRLIIAAARGLVVTPQARNGRRTPTPNPYPQREGGLGEIRHAQTSQGLLSSPTAIGFSFPEGAPGFPSPLRGGARDGGIGTARPPVFSLFDPQRRPTSHRRATAFRPAAPRTSWLDRFTLVFFPARQTLPAKLSSPEAPVDAARVARRIAALAAVLDDLPAQARRFARWKVSRDMAGAQSKKLDAEGAQSKNLDVEGAQNSEPLDVARAQNSRRLSPLRACRQPVWCKPGTRSAHEFRAARGHLRGLGFRAIQPPDTS